MLIFFIISTVKIYIFIRPANFKISLVEILVKFLYSFGFTIYFKTAYENE